MAWIERRKRSDGGTSAVVRWRLGGTRSGPVQSQTFGTGSDDENLASAEQFKQRVEAAGHFWPDGWGKDTGVVAPLYERERELSRLRHALRNASRGSGGIIVVEGEAGAGKTALLAAAAAEAELLGMRVLPARGAILERDFAYGIVRQLFEAVLIGADDTVRRSLLRGRAAVAGAVLGLGEVDDVGARDAAFAAFSGLYWMAVGFSSSEPLLLVVDDAQWADIASLQWLAFLAHSRLDDVPICVAIGWRTGEPDAPEELRRIVLTEPGVERLAPRPLSGAASATLLERALGTVDDELSALCHGRTGGNPFLLVELTRALLAEGVVDRDARLRLAGRLSPETIRQSILLRLAHVPEAAELARAVAVLDSDAASRHAAALAGLSAEQMVQQAQLLGEAGVLTLGTSLRFAHPILRTVVYEDMAPHARSIAHRRAADLLAASGAPDQAAVHLLQCEPMGQESVARSLRETAIRQVTHGALDAAIPLLARALAEPPSPGDRPQILYELGHAEMLAGHPDAVRHLREAYADTSSAEQQVTIARELAGALAEAGRAEDALELLVTLADLLVGRPDLALAVEGDAGSIAQVSGRLRGAHAQRLALAAARATGDTAAGRRLLVTYAYGGVAAGDLTAAEVAELVDRASASGDVFSDEESAHALSPSLPWAIACEVALDRLEVAEAHARQALGRGRARGSPLSVLTAGGYLARIRYLCADLHRAEVDAQEALHAAEASARSYYLDWPVSQLGLILVELDRPEDALALLAEHGFGERDLPRGLFAPHFVAEARISTWLALGRLDLAAADAELLWKLGRGCSSPMLARRGLVAEALLAAGNRARAAEVAAAELEAAETWGLPSARGAALRVLGLATRGAAGLDLLARSVTELDGTPHRLDLARALIDLGRERRLGREPSAARQPLRRALDLTEDGRAPALAQRARTELVLTGARPRRDTATPLNTLTAAERRVATLVAAGKGNDTVAQSLFVTRRTVETHLTSVYRKLGISTRHELAEALARQEAALV